MRDPQLPVQRDIDVIPEMQYLKYPEPTRNRSQSPGTYEK
jgi:hypothetical protein